MDKETFKKAKRIDTMLSVLEEEQRGLYSKCYDTFIISGVSRDGGVKRLAGIEPDLMLVIKQWYYDKIQKLETEFEEL